MANFRRRRPRLRTHGNFSDQTYFLNTWPSWFDRLFHNRPARRRAKLITHKVLRGEIDADNAAWDIHGNRPQTYYW